MDDRNRTQWLDLDEPFRKAERIGSQADASGLGKLLHPSGEVGCVADCGVVHFKVASDGADHDLARIKAYASVDIDPMLPACLLGVFTHSVLNRESGVAGPEGVVL